MALTLVATSGSGVDQVYRRDAAGKVRLEEADRSEYVLPPVKMKARFELTGWSEPFEMPDNFNEGQTKTKITAEWRVAKGLSNTGKAYEGKKFRTMFTYSLNPRSGLAQLLTAMRGDPIAPNETVDLESFIGWQFVGQTRGQQGDPTKFGGIGTDSIEEDSVRPWDGAKAAVRAVVSDDAEDDNPFADDDE